jgi:nitrogen fixation/metabolism regulation signal transduction histidine kinase
MMTKTDPVCWRSVSEEGFRFFGEMSASVSHEIRNKLAVINEKAGLVQDIALAMKSGRSIDPDRLDIQAGKIIEQIRKANQIVGALSRLAHSVDRSGIRIDLADLIGLVVELHGRKAAQAEITIDVVVPADSVSLITSPFLLQDLIGACINAALPRVDDSRIMTIAAESRSDGAVIRFQHLAGISESDTALGGEGTGARTILAMLGGRLSADRRRGELVLEVKNHEEREGGSQP